MEIRKFTPSADKRVLVLMAGAMWCGVGILLVHFALSWIAVTKGTEKILLYAAGFLAAMPIHHFGFLKVADKNLRRLLPLSVKRCVFSFMTWKSYILVAFMMTLGITLRHSSIPKPYLSVLYNGIGLALFLSGIRYFRFFFKLILSKESEKTVTSGISSRH
jgi:hypothetical protein